MQKVMCIIIPGLFIAIFLGAFDSSPQTDLGQQVFMQSEKSSTEIFRGDDLLPELEPQEDVRLEDVVFHWWNGKRKNSWNVMPDHKDLG